MPIVEVSIVPLGTRSTSLSALLVPALRILKDSSIQYELTGMGTILTGDLDEILNVLRQMHESCFSSDVMRVLTTIRIDDRRDRQGTPEQKVASVLEKLESKP
jgi:uncharacterized protein (TIGR00106 family)